jgi:hypothetical protein
MSHLVHLGHATHLIVPGEPKFPRDFFVPASTLRAVHNRTATEPPRLRNRMYVHLRALVALVCGIAIAGTATAANAKGTARVRQSDGVVRDYRVSLHVIDHRAVRIVSADGRGTLIVSKAACSYAGELERCLPYRIVLDQAGKKHPIELERGTEYLNRTDSVQLLPLSSRQVPPHGLLLLLLTTHGTYITVSGTVDGISG